MTTHVNDTDLALFATGDLAAWQRLQVSIHVRQCDECRAMVDAYRSDAEYLKVSAQDLPEGVDWDQLSAEMSANIHLGLAAGECVSQPAKRSEISSPWAGFWGWRAAAAASGMVVLLVCAWWLNMPRGDTEAMNRVLTALWHSGPLGSQEQDQRPVVEASSEGIEFRENGAALGMAAMDGAEPLSVTVSNTGASAQYMDEDTGQLVITTVYVP